jgi:hypothetical protein
MPRKRPPSTIEIGSPGLRTSGGIVFEELHPRLRGPKAMRTFEEMRDNDAVVGAVLYAIEAFLRRVSWKAVGPDETEQKYLESVLDDMDVPFSDFISDALSFLPFGFALFEKVLKVRKDANSDNARFYSKYPDGRFGLRCLALRGQSSIWQWNIDESTGEILGCWQRNEFGTIATREVYLPLDRCVLLRTKTYKNNPEGRSILRNAYRSWFFKKRLEETEAIGISRDLVGIPKVEIPAQLMSPNATDEQKATRAAFERLVSSIHRDEREGIVFPSETGEDGKSTGYKLTLMASPGQKQIPADPVIRRHDARIAMSMMAEFILLGTEKQGSFALGADKSANFIKSLGWYIDSIQNTLNKDVVDFLYDLNGVPQEKRAYLVHGDIDTPDLRELGLFLQQVATAGLLRPTVETEMRIREVSGLPTDEETLQEDPMQQKLDAEQRKAEQQLALVQAKGQGQDNNGPPKNGSNPQG